MSGKGTRGLQPWKVKHPTQGVNMSPVIHSYSDGLGLDNFHSCWGCFLVGCGRGAKQADCGTVLTNSLQASIAIYGSRVCVAGLC